MKFGNYYFLKVATVLARCHVYNAIHAEQELSLDQLVIYQPKTISQICQWWNNHHRRVRISLFTFFPGHFIPILLHIIKYQYLYRTLSHYWENKVCLICDTEAQDTLCSIYHHITLLTGQSWQLWQVHNSHLLLDSLNRIEISTLY